MTLLLRRINADGSMALLVIECDFDADATATDVQQALHVAADALEAGRDGEARRVLAEVGPCINGLLDSVGWLLSFLNDYRGPASVA